jgi:hypothetical protein
MHLTPERPLESSPSTDRRSVVARLAMCAAIVGCLAACTLTDLDYLMTGAGGGGGGGGGGSGGGGGAACPGSPDLDTDRRNCGSCGHDCLEGACEGGACRPFLLESGLARPYYMELDATHVYFSDAAESEAGGVFRLTKQGTGLQRLAPQEAAWTLALDEDTVFFTRAGSGRGLWRVSKDGTGGATALPGADAFEVVLDPSEPSRLWFAEYDERDPRQVFRWNKTASGQPEPLANVDQCESLAIVGADLLLGGNAMQRMPKGGGSLETLASRKARRVAVDATDVYWVDYLSASVYAAPHDGSAGERRVATGPAAVELGDIAVDETHVYWAVSASPGYIVRARKDGSEPEGTILAEGQGVSPGIALDDEAVYWTVWEGAAGTLDGKLMKLAK